MSADDQMPHRTKCERRPNPPVILSGAGPHGRSRKTSNIPGSSRGASTPIQQTDAESLVGPEWYRLTPLQRWSESEKLWQTYLALGGFLDPEPDTQGPFFERGRRVRAQLMGGQACVLYGEASKSRQHGRGSAQIEQIRKSDMGQESNLRLRYAGVCDQCRLMR